MSDIRGSRKSGGVALLIKKDQLHSLDQPLCNIQNIELISGIIDLNITGMECTVIIAVVYKDHAGGETSMKRELLIRLQQIFEEIGSKRGRVLSY